jgi:hypothetical protein
MKLEYLALGKEIDFLKLISTSRGNSSNHKSTALMNALIKARNYYELSAK